LAAAAETTLNASREDADRASQTALVESLHAAYIAVAQTSIDRSLTRVNVLTASISAVTTIYTALLALVYAAKSDSGKPLNAAALMPAIFLGLALFLVAVYATAFKNSQRLQGPRLITGVGGELVEIRLNTFMDFCFAVVGQRVWALHAGIVSFGWAVLTLPVPFVKLNGDQQLGFLVVGLIAVAFTGA